MPVIEGAQGPNFGQILSQQQAQAQQEGGNEEHKKGFVNNSVVAFLFKPVDCMSGLFGNLLQVNQAVLQSLMMSGLLSVAGALGEKSMWGVDFLGKVAKFIFVGSPEEVPGFSAGGEGAPSEFHAETMEHGQAMYGAGAGEMSHAEYPIQSGYSPDFTPLQQDQDLSRGTAAT